MPFGNKSTWDNFAANLMPPLESASPMPFGNKSTWDLPEYAEITRDAAIGHQCLSATSPLGTCKAKCPIQSD